MFPYSAAQGEHCPASCRSAACVVGGEGDDNREEGVVYAPAFPMSPVGLRDHTRLRGNVSAFSREERWHGMELRLSPTQDAVA